MLISNLNEIIEEFAKTVEDSLVERVETFGEKEVQGQDIEPEVKIEEERERKRVEEEEKQRGDEEVDEFVSDKDYEIMEKIFKKDFIGERGLKKFISPFKEIIEKRGRRFIW